MSTLGKPVVGYVGAVLGVIAVASLAVFNLQGLAAKSHRHWDADIDRIIARQQAKKQGLVALARAETPGVVSDVGPQIAALAREPLLEDDKEAALGNEGIAPAKAQMHATKKSSRRANRQPQQQHYVPTAFAMLPIFTTPATATTTTTLFRLR
jgi:hypothetical protein